MEALCCTGLIIVKLIRGEEKSNICLIFAQTQRGYEHESPLSPCVFKARSDTFTLLLSLMGIEWMLTYHLSPLLAANVVN